MGRKFYFKFTLFMVFIVFVTKNNSLDTEPGQGDTSIYDFVAFHLLEDYVDLLEMTAWFGRRVKDHIDGLLDESFLQLTAQQNMLQPALDLTDRHNRPECAEGKIINVTDVIFKEYFNMNINCNMIGQKMAVFFNELHNITERITAIHRRHINMAPGCGPPHIPNLDRECLHNVANQCKRETNAVREYMLKLNYDVEEFMDGQIEEAFLCTITGMRNVRNVTKQAVQDIHCCLDIEDNYEISKKYESPMLYESMGKLKKPFDHLQISKEAEQRMRESLSTPVFPPVGRPHPGMVHQFQPHPPHVQHHGQPAMGPPPPHPGMPPQFVQNPGMQPQIVQHPGMHPQFIQHPGMHLQHQQFQQPPGMMHPRNPLQSESGSAPPWRINPRNVPRYAEDRDMDDSFEFDPSMFSENEKQFGNIFGEEMSDENDSYYQATGANPLANNFRESL